MSIEKLFEGLDNIYTGEWYNKGKGLFHNHPSNTNKKDSFKVKIFNDTVPEYYEKNIDLNDFLCGVRDDSFDDWFDEKEMNNKLEPIGELPNGYPDYGLIKGKKLKHSSDFYPKPNFGEWKRMLKKEIDTSLKLITALGDKEKYFNYIKSEIKDRRKTIHNESINEFNEFIINQFKEIDDYISKQSERITEIQNIIDNDKITDKLAFNLSQSQLAKLIYLLKQKGFFEKNNVKEITDFFSKYTTVLQNNESKKPNSLRAAFNKLNKEKSSSTWADGITIEL